MAHTINVESRSDAKVSDLRENKLLPAVVYGFEVENQKVQLSLRDFEKVYAAAGESQVVQLAVAGGKTANVLIKEIQIDPLKRDFIHADFLSIDVSKPVEVELPLLFTGIAPAVKASGGSLIKKEHTIHIRCLPVDLVAHIEVPLEKLETLEDSILFSDLNFPKTFTLLNNESDLVASVIPPRLEVEPVVAEESADAPVTEGEEDGESPAEGADAPVADDKKE